jgi:excisionase family DNA binding protein
LNTLPNKALLRPDEVADYFSVDVRTVYLWIEEGIIQNAIRVTKKTIRIPREEAIRIQKPAAV